MRVAITAAATAFPLPLRATACRNDAELDAVGAGGCSAVPHGLLVGRLVRIGDRPSGAGLAILWIERYREALVAESGDDLAQLLEALVGRAPFAGFDCVGGGDLRRWRIERAAARKGVSRPDRHAWMRRQQKCS